MIVKQINYLRNLEIVDCTHDKEMSKNRESNNVSFTPSGFTVKRATIKCNESLFILMDASASVF